MGLTLGTAQWGTAYGLTNAIGFLDDEAIAAVIDEARALEIRSVDTHRAGNPTQGYGDAQSRLRPWARDFAVTTKVIAGPSADLPIREQLEASLAELGLDAVAAVLVHDWAGLDDSRAAGAAQELASLQDAGLMSRIGVSAYDREDLVRAHQHFASLDVIQVPTSVLDQRLVHSSLVRDLHVSGTRVQVRSVFLQGLLLAPGHDSSLAQHPDVLAFHDWCAAAGIAALEACLGFMRQIPWADEVVVGVTSAAELAEIGRAWRDGGRSRPWGELASDDTDLIDPRRWNA